MSGKSIDTAHRRETAPATPLMLASVAVMVLIPPLMFLGSALYRDMPAAAGVAALLEQYGAERVNLTAITVLGMLPLALVALLIGIRRLVRKTWNNGREYVVGGVLPIFAVTVFVHLQYWPSYLPSRRFMGFPHGIEFTIGPLFFAPVGVLLGFLIVWTLRRRS